MRDLAFFLILMMAVLVQGAVVEEYLEKCEYCFLYSFFNPVCGEHRGTYWNMCALKCDNAVFLHHGYCTAEDLFENDWAIY